VITMGESETWLTELYDVLVADPEPMPCAQNDFVPTWIEVAEPMPTLIKARVLVGDEDPPIRRAVRRRRRTAVKPTRRAPHERGGDVADLLEAAQYLKISPRTLRDYINHRKFKKEDGLRRIGGNLRIYVPVLMARVLDDTLMKKEKPA
jgi:hypothetical protein